MAADRRRRTGLVLGICLVVVVVALVLGANRGSGPRSVAQSAAAIDAVVRCPSCEGLSVADSSSSTAVAIRAAVVSRVRAGQSDAVIEQYLVSRYGESILLRPPTSGLAGAVWVLPVVAVAGALGGVGVVLWRRRSPRETVVSDEDRALVEDALAREAK
ncbi:MAG TPA: cytochrome c-type biogenesis protein [Candidatus Sulfotelmatobacter sp.]|nr:cytochrome c-type biogenesis protein [Candidatus Sulfotelmatobacter sp.]